MSEPNWRRDGAAWRCDLPARPGGPGVTGATLRLRGTRLTLSPVDETTRLLIRPAPEGQVPEREVHVALERTFLSEPEVSLDSDSELLGALMDGHVVRLRLVDAGGEAAWDVPAFPPEMD